jgi:hypothetical protein
MVPMSEHSGVPRSELEAAVEARKELGPEYEQAIVDSLADRLEREIERRVSERTKLRPRQAIGPFAPPVMGIAIGFVVVAGIFGGAIGVVAACIAIIVVAGIALRR